MNGLCRSLWWSITAPLTVVGVAAAFLLLGVGEALLLLGIGTAATALVRWQLQQSSTPQGSWPAALSLAGGWSLLAVVGLAGAFGLGGLGASAAAIAVRALPLRGGRRSADRRGEDAGRPMAAAVGPPAELIPGDPLPQPSAVLTLSTPALCWTWRVSYVRLQRPNCPTYELAHLAALRSACLEELEQRDPVAFSRWLAGARAASDPARFFCPQQHR